MSNAHVTRQTYGKINKVAQPSARQPTADRLRWLGLFQTRPALGQQTVPHEQHRQLSLPIHPLEGFPKSEERL